MLITTFSVFVFLFQTRTLEGERIVKFATSSDILIQIVHLLMKSIVTQMKFWVAVVSNAAV